ncbi:zinc finger Y-chromosomal protein-like [Lissotriton helveticus]
MSRRRREAAGGPTLKKRKGKPAAQGEEERELSASTEDAVVGQGMVYIDSLGISYQDSPNANQYQFPKKVPKSTVQTQIKLIDENGVTTVQTSTEDSASHEEQVASTSTEDTEYVVDSMQCFTCHIIFTTMASKLRHMRRDHPEVFAKHVNYGPLTYQTSRQKERSLHPPPSKGQVMCLECGETFSSRKLMRAHKNKHKKNSAFSCVICGRRFELLATLRKHQRSHSYDDRDKAGGPYICLDCGAVFPASRGLRLHESIHNKP